LKEPYQKLLEAKRLFFNPILHGLFLQPIFYKRG